jgi:hypothetical protein
MESKKNKRLYFAYGRNMHVEIMAERCPAARMAGLATLPGYRLLINTRGVSTVVPDSGHTVYGVLWYLTDACEATLDVFEGIANGHYTKEEAQPLVAGDPVGTTLIYEATGTEVGPPKAGYLEALEEAAAHHDFPAAYRNHFSGLRG